MELERNGEKRVMMKKVRKEEEGTSGSEDGSLFLVHFG